MDKTIKFNLYLGQGEQGARRRAALLALATEAGYPDNLSGWLASLADERLAREARRPLAEGVPAFSEGLHPSWLRALPPTIPLWGIPNPDGGGWSGWVAAWEQPPGGRPFEDAVTWLEWVTERYSED